MGQPQQFGAFNQPQGQWGGAQSQWGAAQSMGQFPNQQQGFPGQQPGFPGQQFPGQPQMGGAMMMPQTGQMPYGNFSGGQMAAIPQSQQQTPPSKHLPQFDWSSAPGNKPLTSTSGISMTGSTGTNPASLGWSNNLSKPAPSSIWDQAQQKPAEPQQPPVPVQPGSWSSSLLSSGSMGSQPGAGAGQANWAQTQTGFGQTSPQASNPFGVSSMKGRRGRERERGRNRESGRCMWVQS